MSFRITKEDAAQARAAWEARTGKKWAGPSASASSPAASIASAKLQKIIADYQARNPNPIKVATPAEPSEKLLEVQRVADAIGRIARGEAVEASGRDGYLGVYVERV